jgi:hypothetical protein
MNVLEDKIRAAFQQTAADISQHEVPPLRLPAGRQPDRRGLPGRRVTFGGRAGWHHWWPRFAPLVAAAAVAAVVAGSLAVSGAFQGRQHATGSASGPFAGVPPYYVVLTGKNPNQKPNLALRQFAQVRATATGAVLASVTPPKPYGTFSAAAAGNGHTFVLAANKWKVVRANGGTFAEATATKFFLLRLGAGGRPRQLTPLPIPAMPPGAEISGFALTRDGSKLAVALRGGINGGPGPEIQVFTLSTGAERVWTWPGAGPITNNAGGNGEVLSWTADGRTLAFQQWVGNSIDVRLLDATTPGGSLQSDSRLAVQWKDDAESFHFVHGKASNIIEGFSAIITGDGTKIVAATASETKHPLNSELAFTEFSANTGKVADILGRWPIPGMYPGQTQDVLWTSSSGRTLIVLAHVPGPATKDPHSRNSAGYSIEFGVLNGNRFTPLPGAPRPGPNPWPAW